METRLRLLVPALVILSLAGALYAQTSPPPNSTRTTSKKAAPVSKEVQELKAAVEVQQRQIQQQRELVEQLRSQLQQLAASTQQANSAAQKAQSSVDQAQSAAVQAQQSASDAQKVAEQASTNAAETKTQLAAVNTAEQDTHRQLAALQALASRFRFSGDVRVRGENFSQGNVPDFGRARIRVRFGLDGQLNQDFVAGFALATGSLGDPTSTNETLTNSFDRKTIALDRGYITFNPVAFPWFSVTGGKFAYSWQRTSVTFDPDLNPEGFNETFSFNFTGPVKNFTMEGIQLLYNDTTGKPGATHNSYALGGQLSARLQVGPWTATPSVLSLKWNEPSAILQ